MVRGPLLGRGQVAICMRSGVKMKRIEMVEDGQVKGLLVHPDWWDPYHPLLLPPPMRPDGLPRRRPAPDDSSMSTIPELTVVLSGLSASLTWTPSTNNETLMRLYQVWRATGASAAAVQIATVDIVQDITIEDDVDGSWQQEFYYEQPFIDDTLIAGEVYTYYIVAIPYYGGQAATSNEVMVQYLDSVMSGVASIVFGASATLAGILRGSASMAFTTVGGGAVLVPIAGTTSATFAASGTVEQPSGPGIDTFVLTFSTFDGDTIFSDSTPIGWSHGNGSLVSGGGLGGIDVAAMVFVPGSDLYFQLTASKTDFVSSPFVADNTFWNEISWIDVDSNPQSFSSTSYASYTTGSNSSYWYAQWGYTNPSQGAGVNTSNNFTFTVS